ncbi:dual specificity protein phosphatase 12 [Ascobolus immersus RN42]|uniref:protein-tyrosine-phosphatase n=1 Tax=Ascobolus immersus RN42 TaxID=1160509 RepID=A0A3N4HZI3_ASCIM|nr:dual specificity protein phosphatase 12 [Ascobolus immersus RN42]
MNKLEDEDIYIGGWVTLVEHGGLRDSPITHILSVLDMDLKEHRLQKFQRLIIKAYDTDEENLLVQFPQTNSFIKHALESRGSVLVHCAAGKSRSATVVAAYLMATYKIDVAEALERIRKVRPFCEPNEGFMGQLELYHEMGFPGTVEAIEDHPKYQHWIWKREVEVAAAARMAPDRILYHDQERQVGKVLGVERDSSDKALLEFRCKSCRKPIGTSHTVVPHDKKKAEEAYRRSRKGPNSNELPCAHHFLEPLLWMKPELEQGKLEGRLECPNQHCKSKIGSYAWHGMRCSCGEWVVPGISIQRSKIDEIRLSPNKL